MKIKKIIKLGMTVAFAMTMFVGGISGGMQVQEVKAAGSIPDIKANIPKAVLRDTLKPYKVNPGDTVEVVIPFRASNYRLKDPVIGIDFSKTSGFTLVGDTVVYTKESESIKTITVTDKAFLKFSVYIPLNAQKGTYNNIPIRFITTDSLGEYTEVELEQVSKLTFIVDSQKKGAAFSFLGAEFPDEVKAEDDFDITIGFSNKGELKAKKIKVTLGGYESKFMLSGSQPTREFEEVAPGQKIEMAYNLVAGKTLMDEFLPLTATIKYENEDGTEAEAQEFKFALPTVAKESLEKPVIQVANVNYPRHTLRSGETFDIEYTFVNTGKEDAKDVVIDVTGYSEAGFKPDKAYSKFRIPVLKAGKEKKMKRTFTAVENITSGMKPVAVSFTYYSVADATSASQISDSMNVYIDVRGKEDEKNGDLNNSIPRLMISKYDTGEEKIMAGKIFNFTFDVLNTHTGASADNIKATVSSADGSFSIVEGSPSFYISSLKAGESKNLTIPLKVKGDIATNGYDLSIKFEYEYLKKDTANNNATLTKQTTELTEVLKLQVFSNDRPMISNIRVGDGEPPKFMDSSTLTFDFNNLGKSPLYNVTAKITGDFKSSNEVLIIGNVNAGEGKSWSMEVTPSVEMMGSGVLTISYEDSNGNVKSYDTNFESEIMPADSGMSDMPIMPEMPMVEEKKDIMPMWVFILIQIAVFGVATLVTKNMLIKRYKKNKRAEIEKEDEEF